MIGKKIILEGVDGAGKSTLAEKILKDNPDFRLVHCSRHTDNTYKYFKDLLLSEENLIFDRFMYGQFVYQTASERKSKGWLDLSSLIDLDFLIKDIGADLIYVYSDLKKCLVNCKKDSDDSYYTLEYLKELDLKFRFIFDTVSVPNVKYHNNEYDLAKELDINHIARNFSFKDLPRILAVDFDGCLATDCFPHIQHAKPNLGLMARLKIEKAEGAKLILWTCRTDDALIDACNFCADHGLYFDAVNENIDEIKNNLEGGPRKVFASVYLDDKALNETFIL